MCAHYAQRPTLVNSHRLSRQWGPLVNPGRGRPENKCLDMTDADWQRVLDVDLSSAFYPPGITVSAVSPGPTSPAR